MKSSQYFPVTLALVAFSVLAFIQPACAQESAAHKKAAQLATVKSMVDAKDYVFVVESVSPASGPTRQLTPYYTLDVHGDTLVADLPYFGRAYVAPVDPSTGGIHFTSTKFTYNISNRKKGGWQVDIQPGDQSDVRQLSLTIFENGNASLLVVSNNRQSISYHGYIRDNNRGK